MSGFIEAVEEAQENNQRLRQEVNNLLALLRSFQVVSLVNKKFKDCHDNEAPGELLLDQMFTVQELLNT